MTVAIGCGLVQFVIAGVPLPQLDPGSFEYTRAVGFFVGPLLPVPALAVTLAGVEPYNSQAARSLVVCRIAIAVAGIVWIFLVMYPSALTKPTDNAVQVLVENVAALAGLTILVGCWVDVRWSWVIVYVPALLGVTGPERGWVSKIQLVDRTVSGWDLGSGLVFVTVALGLYGILGPAGSRTQRSAKLRRLSSA